MSYPEFLEEEKHRKQALIAFIKMSDPHYSAMDLSKYSIAELVVIKAKIESDRSPGKKE